MELREYLNIIRRRLWMIAVFVLLATLTTAIVSYYFIQPIYEASTKLIVNRSNDEAGVPQLDFNTVNMNLKLIDTYKEIIKTPRIMDKVLELHPELNMTTDELISTVKVSSVNNTQVMTLEAQDASYEKAAHIVNAVSSVFKDEIPSIMKVDNVSILNEALPNANPEPVKPKPLLNILISFIVSFMMGLGIAFLLEYLDDTIKSEEDVAQILGLPTLAVISKVKDADITPRGTSSSKQKAGEAPYAAVNQQ